jgi:hypothetical protein
MLAWQYSLAITPRLHYAIPAHEPAGDDEYVPQWFCGLEDASFPATDLKCFAMLDSKQSRRLTTWNFRMTRNI